MKKFKFFSLALLFSFLGHSQSYNSDYILLDLQNKEILFLLIETSNHDGWTLISLYVNPAGKLNAVFKKNKKFKRFRNN